MTKGERWKQFFETRGWVKNDVISGSENETLKITLKSATGTSDKDEATCDRALITPIEGILCHETRTGTVFFQWDDIIMVKVDDATRKKGWL